MMSRVVISGLAGGGGKTLLSLGLCRALVDAGLRVQPFKKGPDYIDAAWLGQAAQKPCTNLDPYFLDESRLRDLFAHTMRHADMAVIEGNRGLYDGRDAAGTCSTAALARTLDAPVVLTMNCTKMTRTAAAIAVGMAGFETYRLAGVVLNQVGNGRHGALVRQCIEDTGIRVLGALPRLRENPIPERHMGLVGVGDNPEADALLHRLANFVREHVDVHSIQAAANLPAVPHGEFWQEPIAAESQQSRRARIGYVRDEALWFYYPENLEALKRAGAELVRVSLLDNASWPQLDGLYIGGGFPELWAGQLAKATNVRNLASLCVSGLPVYAECGGFMVLCQSVRTEEGVFPMAGVFDTSVVFERHPQGLGYVEACVETANPYHPVGTTFRGHEFHYSRCEDFADAALNAETVLRLSGGKGMGHGRDGLCRHNTFAAYTHLFAPAVPHWAINFVEISTAYAKKS